MAEDPIFAQKNVRNNLNLGPNCMRAPRKNVMKSLPCHRSSSIRIRWRVVLKRPVAARGQPDGAAHIFFNVPRIS